MTVKYARAYGVACGRRAVIVANSDFAYAAARELAHSGIEIAAVIDRRGAAPAGEGADGLRILSAAAVTAVAGVHAVQGCRLTRLGARSRRARDPWLECDLILSAGGFAPAVHLHSQAGGKLRWLAEGAMFVPDGAALEALRSLRGLTAWRRRREALLSHRAR